MENQPAEHVQNTSSNDINPLMRLREDLPDNLGFWAEAYFRVEVTTSQRSQAEQKRDLRLFLDFMSAEEGALDRVRWTPRLTRAFTEHLQNMENDSGGRRFANRTINRILAHLKTFAGWIHKSRPFPLGNPMDKFKSLPVGSTLEIERAITPSERRKILDAADILILTGGRSRSKRKAKIDIASRPRRKGYRPYRNRAIVYCLIETGMRRAAVCSLNGEDVDRKSFRLKAFEKGGRQHTYRISKEGMAAICDYIEREREVDNSRWQSPALFLSAATVPQSTGRLSARTINDVWNAVCQTAGVIGRTPHSARHAMGKHLIEKTGNIAAVQKQLGHQNAAYSMQYARITGDDMLDALNDR